MPLTPAPQFVALRYPPDPEGHEYLGVLLQAVGTTEYGLRRVQIAGREFLFLEQLLIDALVLAGFHLLERARREFPRLTRVGEADAQFERDNPDIVVVLRPRVAGTDARVPALARVEMTH